MGYEFLDRDIEDNAIISIHRAHAAPDETKYKLLNVCEFNSTRKRMSCIFETPDKEIILMCKGADSIIYDLLTEESKQSEVYKET